VANLISLGAGFSIPETSALNAAFNLVPQSGYLTAYANNAAAIAGGLTVGQFYRTGGDPDLICVVH
jgi:hypothetical protein